MEGPIQWARNGDATLAYRTIGAGPFDILFVSGMISHLDVLLEEPGLRRWFERLGRVGRVILMDRRGTGLSDPLPPTFSARDEVRDIEAVLDDLGTERAVLNAYAAGGPPAITFAARRPERTLALVLYGAIVRSLRDDDIAWAFSEEERRERFAEMMQGWGTGVNLDIMAPSAASDERMRAWLGKLERASMTPSGLQRLGDYFTSFDVKDLLPSIRVPTLILHRTDDALIDVRHSRYLAEHIPAARLVEMPGVDSLPMVGDTEALLGEIEEFLTGGRAGSEPERALLTLLFTDIVDATRHAARLGDQRWRDLLAAHDDVVRRELRRFGGQEVKTIGDAFLVTFGAPSHALRCARAIVAAVEELGIEVRAGVHTGECEILGDDIGGMAVHIAARVTAMAKPCEVLASGTAFGTVVGSGMSFDPRGNHELKGVPGRWPIFALADS